MGVIDLVFPKQCVGCGRGGKYLCGECLSGVEKVGAICPECGRASLDGFVHGRCRSNNGMQRLLVTYKYKGVLQKAVKKVKYQSAWGVIEEIGDNWAREMSKQLLDCDAGEIVVTSVPMYKLKERGRGYNQAAKLARILARELGVEYEEMLVRVRETKPQYGMSKKERGENVKGAFKIITNNHIQQLVILVDDVWTTGSTMREGARVLRSSGVAEVWGVAVAR